jgi:HAD superfamily hydrolase (TIGR01490 family)
MKETIAIFDLEGTLCRGGRLFWREIMKNRARDPIGIVMVFLHILHQIILMVFYRLRFISERKMRIISVNNMATLLTGSTHQEMCNLAELIADKMTALPREDIVAILGEHKSKGHRIILISNAFQPILEIIGKRYDVHVSIGTGLEQEGSKYTGRLSTQVCMGDQKALMLRDYIYKAGLDVDLDNSYAYGDTIWDEALLEMVGNPAAVYPDTDLTASAQKRGWRTII